MESRYVFTNSTNTHGPATYRSKRAATQWTPSASNATWKNKTKINRIQKLSKRRPTCTCPSPMSSQHWPRILHHTFISPSQYWWKRNYRHGTRRYVTVPGKFGLLMVEGPKLHWRREKYTLIRTVLNFFFRFGFTFDGLERKSRRWHADKRWM